MRAVFILVLACVAVTLTGVNAQSPIPYRADGFQIGVGRVGTAPIALDMFVDVMCPDCAAAWPNILDVQAYYGSNASINIHTFPLPYHANGFVAAQATHAIFDTLASTGRAIASDYIGFLKWIFANQQTYWNTATEHMSAVQIIAQMQTDVVKNGFISAADFTAAMADENINEETRVSWKYACSRGVLGTPTFLVNGVNVNGAPSWTLADWRILLDPLLAVQPATTRDVTVNPSSSKCVTRAYIDRLFVHSVAACPDGEPTCTYLPGKVECCFKGENCIPNVGCRC